ncbi:anti-sigma factor [Salinicoccus carnicancri]|uniref:anti-sigma factor n=1 Tax=Salinicoccus carnicancri TaxID=558170 RepID=UPI000305BD60|nr:anti-sigma factor [Salinicoccus carnicancri]
MNDSRHCDRLIDYYNGHLDQKEEAEFEKHLEECPDCQAELAEWEALNAELARNTEQLDPPDGMEDRILGNIFAEDTKQEQNPVDDRDTARYKNEKRTKTGFYKKLLIPLAAALLLSVIGNIYLWNAQQQTESLSQALLEDGETINLAPTSEAEGMNAKIAMHETNGSQTLVLQAQNFTDLNEGEVYQVWLLKDEQPYRAGTLVPNDSGEGYTVFTLDDAQDVDWDTVAITVEASPQNQAPQGDIVMSADF